MLKNTLGNKTAKRVERSLISTKIKYDQTRIRAKLNMLDTIFLQLQVINS